MRVKALMTMLAALTLALAAFTGAAFANDGGDRGKSDQTPAAANPTPPVQRSQVGTPAPAKSESKPSSKSDSKGQSKGQSKGESKGQSALAQHHVIVCHRTGSDSNPYVVINIPLTAWVNAHSPETGSHPDLNGRQDILLKDPASGPGSKDGFTKASCGSAAIKADVKGSEKSSEKSNDCSGKTSHKTSSKSKCGENAAGATATTTQSCAAVTTVTTIVGGVWHKTGAFKDGKPKYVFIRPSKTSAHYDASKHPDDIIVADRTETTTTSAAENCKAATPPVTITTTTTPAVPATATPTTILIPAAAQAASAARRANPAPAPASAGVAGAVFKASPKAASAAKPVGGVLGATARFGKSLGTTATSGTLPFTGLPLWIAALVGLALLAGGLALRRGGASSSTTTT